MRIFPSLSIVVPVYNELTRIPRAMPALINWAVRDGETEILLVENGSTDGTLSLCRQYQRSISRHRVRVESTNGERGKGAACRLGAYAAMGHDLYFCDVDLSAPLSTIHEMRDLMARTGADIVIGTRAAPGANVVTTHWRRFQGRAFNALVNLIMPGVSDTQCGFKLARRSCAERVFEHVRTPGFAWDVEFLYVARRMGFRIAEHPVKWVADSESRVTWRDPFRMAWDVMSIPIRHRERVLVKRELPG